MSARIKGSVQLSKTKPTRELCRIACSSQHEGAEVIFENVLKDALETVDLPQTDMSIDFGRKGFTYDVANGQGEFELPLEMAKAFETNDQLFLDVLYEGLLNKGFLEMPQNAWAGIRVMVTA